MHGRETHLRSVAHQQQDEGGPQPRPVHVIRAQEQIREQQGRAPAERRVGQEEGSEQRERDADRSDQQVLPGRLDRARCPVEVDERRRREGGRLDPHPHEAQVLRADDQRRHPQETQQARHEGAVRELAAIVQVPDRIHCADREQAAEQEQHQASGGIQREPASEGTRTRLRNRRQGQRQVTGRGHRQYDRAPAIRREPGGQCRSQHGQGDQSEQQQRLIPSGKPGGACRATRTRVGCDG